MTPTRITAMALFALSGCATIQLPQEKLESSSASVRGAEEMGAANVPSARLHLELAKDEIANARKLAADGNERATVVLAKGEADAELAMGMAREVAVHAEAEQAAIELRAVEARGTP
jgi:hypothetical protein